MFRRILIANRGEIAVRVMATCQRLGIETVAVYSDADCNAWHVEQANRAIHIGPAAAAESYLNGSAIIQAALSNGAQAIHPGYGFLSENADFAQAVTDAGLAFIGPSPDTINKMGSKADAKRIMEAAGVPLVPGYHRQDQSSKALSKAAEAIGYPLMIKAAAGGGGKGMRIVRQAKEFTAELESARREAKKAFADEVVILERYIEQPRHVEVQIFGDQHGNHVHLFERDCSSQRRYQKVIEEAPAPGLEEASRDAMYQAAVAAAKAVDYCGAGTVEFILDAEDRFYFMEMNTRLQVEHPVTELTTGLDLVEWQLQVAAGEALPLAQQDITSSGHAIEARIYAEDPASGFLPAAGRLDYLRFPAATDQIRIDTGVREGDEISIHYDPMIAKLIVHAADREQALAMLQQALRQVVLIGPASNAGFLQSLAGLPRLANGNMTTNYLDQHLDQVLEQQDPDPETLLLAAVAAELLAQENDSRQAARDSADPCSPWALADGWRPGHPGKRVVRLQYRDQTLIYDCYGHDGNYRIEGTDDTQQLSEAGRDAAVIRFRLGKRECHYPVHSHGDDIQVIGQTARLMLKRVSPLFDPADDLAVADSVLAPMPGQIVSLTCKSGDTVNQGDRLIIMEAMKMELSLTAPRDGKVANVLCEAGQFVDAERVLIELEQEDE